jgi:hypothetical protein
MAPEPSSWSATVYLLALFLLSHKSDILTTCIYPHIIEIITLSGRGSMHCLFTVRLREFDPGREYYIELAHTTFLVKYLQQTVALATQR